MNKIKIAIISFLFILPVVSFGATTYRYNTCTDWTLVNTTCDNAIFSYDAGIGAYILAQTNTTNTPFLTAGTWYVNFTYNGSGTLRFSDDVSDINYLYFTNSAIDETYISTAGSEFIQIYTVNFIGTISDLCITDTIGGCVILPPPPQPQGLFSFKKENGDISNNPSDLVASVGTISTDTFSSTLPYMLVFIGIPLAFYILQSLKSIVIPKETKKDNIIRDKGGKQIGIGVSNSGYERIISKGGVEQGWKRK